MYSNTHFGIGVFFYFSFHLIFFQWNPACEQSASIFTEQGQLLCCFFSRTCFASTEITRRLIGCLMFVWKKVQGDYILESISRISVLNLQIVSFSLILFLLQKDVHMRRMWCASSRILNVFSRPLCLKWVRSRFFDHIQRERKHVWQILEF